MRFLFQFTFLSENNYLEISADYSFILNKYIVDLILKISIVIFQLFAEIEYWCEICENETSTTMHSKQNYFLQHLSSKTNSSEELTCKWPKDTKHKGESDWNIHTHKIQQPW